MITSGSVVDHFTENNGSLGSLVRGSASVHEQDIIIGATWAKIASPGTLAWFDRVYNAANPVDGVWQWRDISFPAEVVGELRRRVSVCQVQS